MQSDVVCLSTEREIDELESLVRTIESARDKAFASDLRFLTYLLGMAHMEGANLLKQKQREKH